MISGQSHTTKSNKHTYFRSRSTNVNNTTTDSTSTQQLGDDHTNKRSSQSGRDRWKICGKHALIQQQVNEAGLLYIDIDDEEDEGDVKCDAPFLHSMSIEGDDVMISLCNFTLSEILDYDINYIINFDETPIQYDIWLGTNVLWMKCWSNLLIERKESFLPLKTDILKYSIVNHFWFLKTARCIDRWSRRSSVIRIGLR